MRRLIDYLRRDPIWWTTLATVFLAAAVFMFFVLRVGDELAAARTANLPTGLPRPPAAADGGTPAAETVDLTVHESDLSGQPAGARRVARNVVSLIVRTKRNETYLGNGTAIRPGIVLTANHVVSNKDITEIMVICGAVQLVGTVLQSDFATDTALLKVPDCGKETLQVAAVRVSVDDTLFVTGFMQERGAAKPTLYRLFTTTSRIPQARLVFSGNARDEQVVRVMVAAMAKRHIRPLPLAAALPRGMSGSPVFTADGRIIGLVSIADNLHNRTFAIPGWVLERELLRAGIK